MNFSLNIICTHQDITDTVPSIDVDGDFAKLEDALHCPIYGKACQQADLQQVASFFKHTDVWQGSHVGTFCSDAECGNQSITPVFLCNTCSSTFDYARKLLQNNLLPEWGSVLACSQRTGRGQMRRNWVSPLGNIYATVRLPYEGVFTGWNAAFFVGLFLVQAFKGQGIAVTLKWPNDILLQDKKLAGILLEERGGVLLLGIGINVASAPVKDQMRQDSLIGAISLQEHFMLQEHSIAVDLFLFWCQLLECFHQKFQIYMQKETLQNSVNTTTNVVYWKDIALVGQRIRLHDPLLENAEEDVEKDVKGDAPRSAVEGVLLGVTIQGSLVVQTAQGEQAYVSGSVQPV